MGISQPCEIGIIKYLVLWRQVLHHLSPHSVYRWSRGRCSILVAEANSLNMVPPFSDLDLAMFIPTLESKELSSESTGPMLTITPVIHIYGLYISAEIRAREHLGSIASCGHFRQSFQLKYCAIWFMDTSHFYDNQIHVFVHFT